MYSHSKTSQWIYMCLQTVPYYCLIDTEFVWFPLNHIPEFNKNKNYSELLSLLFYLSQGSLHQVSPKFLEQTLDKKLMSNMRVRWWIPWYWPLVFCHQYVGEKASINVIIYIYIATCIIAQWIHAAHYLRLKWHWKNDWKYNHALLK